MRTHLWGGTTYFNVAGEKPGQVYAQALGDWLQTKGWQDKAWNVRVAPAGAVQDADILISGQIFEFVAKSQSRKFSASCKTSNKVPISARNKVDSRLT